MPIPADDDITKTDLWNRIDEVFPVIANVTSQLQPQITYIKEATMAAVKNELEEYNKKLDQHTADIDAKLNNYTKRINEVIYNALKNLAEENSKNLKNLEEKMRNLQSTVPTTVVDQAISFLNPAVARIAEIAKDVEAFKKNTIDSTGKYQTEMVSKVSSLSKKLDEVLDKFKKLSSSF